MYSCSSGDDFGVDGAPPLPSPAAAPAVSRMSKNEQNRKLVKIQKLLLNSIQLNNKLKSQLSPLKENEQKITPFIIE